MSNSSQPSSSSITSSDTYTIDVSGLSTFNFTNNDTITFSNYSPCTVSYPTYYSSPSISTLTTTQIGSIASIDTSAFTITFPEEWVHSFPDIKRVEKMCEEYPGLKIAYEKFKTVYKLVADHYDTPKDKRPKP
jgi:hypothetical protein